MEIETDFFTLVITRLKNSSDEKVSIFFANSEYIFVAVPLIETELWRIEFEKKHVIFETWRSKHNKMKKKMHHFEMLFESNFYKFRRYLNCPHSRNKNCPHQKKKGISSTYTKFTYPKSCSRIKRTTCLRILEFNFLKIIFRN